MRVLTSDRFGRWTRGIGLVALVALVWVLFVPGGVFWTAVLASSVIGAAVATAVLVRSRQVPTLAQAIATARAEPVAALAGSRFTSGAGLRPRGERAP
jgi:hypothetical protein